MSGLGDIFKKPKAPQAAAPTAAPDLESPAIKEAGRRRVREEQARSGRDGTNLSGAPVTYASRELGR